MMTIKTIREIAKARHNPCSVYKLDDVQMSEDDLNFFQMAYESFDKLLDIVDAASKLADYVEECYPELHVTDTIRERLKEIGVTKNAKV